MLGLSVMQFAALRRPNEPVFTHHPELLQCNLMGLHQRMNSAECLKIFLSIPEEISSAIRGAGNVHKAAYAAYQTAVLLRRAKKRGKWYQDDLLKRVEIVEKKVDMTDKNGMNEKKIGMTDKRVGMTQKNFEQLDEYVKNNIERLNENLQNVSETATQARRDVKSLGPKVLASFQGLSEWVNEKVANTEV
ncbi:hypothetical protein K440DRAFT_639322 [Wilcoxina mikolae CBS 423.85]|nr:hypothetical protein K440DRAFT_639322 [Wilcoxina mikolae CBS 423.85]